MCVTPISYLKSYTTLLKNARDLRSNQTDAENRIWYHLRNRRFHTLKFRRQYSIGCYIVDFICFEEKLIIELDGGQVIYNNVKAPYDHTH
jgi:very-short-patch-repair endonuclease